MAKTRTMLFHLFGVALEEEYEVLKENDRVVVLSTDDDESKCYRFCKKSGKCLNDNRHNGAFRTLKLV